VGVPERPDHRIGDAERDAVVDELKVHFGAGRLSIDELEERTARALAARTSGDLVPLTDDLPAIAAPVPATDDVWKRAFSLHVRIAVLLAVVSVLIWIVSLGSLSPVVPLLVIAGSVVAHAGWQRFQGHR
jgi:hypothetical protein